MSLENTHNIEPLVWDEFKYVLVGPEEHRHFIVKGNRLICVKGVTEEGGETPCSDCPMSLDCEQRETEFERNVIPSPRRAIGFESQSFLTLKPKVNDVWDKLAELGEDWVPQYIEYAKHPANRHWALDDWDNAGQFRMHTNIPRFYGTVEEFEAHPCSKWFDVFMPYAMNHVIHSLDYSAIEPRISTISSKEPEWVKVFDGKPKVIFREVEFNFSPETANKLPSYLLTTEDGKTFCHLDGEMDKVDYHTQCKKCPISDQCTPIKDYYRKVPTDWHGLNRSAFFRKDIEKADKTAPTYKDWMKKLRGDSKASGLALCYGGSAYTISKSLNLSKEAAQAIINSFFSTLRVHKKWMDNQKKGALKTGYARTMFGRLREVGTLLNSREWGKKSFGERLALNHPIQGMGADILKVGLIRVSNWAHEKGYNPMGGLDTPLEATWGDLSEFVYVPLLTVHDELDSFVYKPKAADLYSEVYEIAQVRDVTKALGVDFLFELDVEYNEESSWTASDQYPRARVYLQMMLRSQDEPTEAILFKLSDLDEPRLEALRQMAKMNEQVEQGDGFFGLMVIRENEEGADDVWLHRQKFTKEQTDYLKAPNVFVSYLD